jgi:hypothetical protein
MATNRKLEISHAVHLSASATNEEKFHNINMQLLMIGIT